MTITHQNHETSTSTVLIIPFWAGNMLSSLPAAQLTRPMCVVCATPLSRYSLSIALLLSEPSLLQFKSFIAYERVPLRSACLMYPFEALGRDGPVVGCRDAYRLLDVRALTVPRKLAAMGFRVGRQAAIIPTFISVLDGR